MNCKPGDLAWIVKCDFPENIGAIVEVLGPGGDYSDIGDSEQHWRVKSVGRELTFSWEYLSLWERLTLHPKFGRGLECDTPDGELRPIRGEEGTDQTLAWKPVPLPAEPELAPKPQREFSL